MTAIITVGSVDRSVAADLFNEVADQTNKKLVKLFGAGGFSRLNNFGTGIIISKDGHVLTVPANCSIPPTSSFIFTTGSG